MFKSISMFKSTRVPALAAVAVASVVMSAGLMGCAPTASTNGGSSGSADSSKAIESKAIEVTNYKVTRYEVDTKQNFDTFVAAYEKAVPAFTPAIFEGVSNWDEVIARTAGIATNGFLIYHKLPTCLDRCRSTGLDHPRGIEYLMGNHVISETMYRHNPAVMLHAPLRVMIFENERGDAVFEIERPSEKFGAYGDERIAEVGVLLDQKLAQLLTVLGAPVPTDLAG
jgi:hypothetical protein